MPAPPLEVLMRARLGVVLFALLAYAIASAQVPSTPAPVFEVASVKRNVSGDIGGTIRVPPFGTVTFTNVMLRVLIREAYQVNAYTERFTLIAGPNARIIGSSTGGPQPDVPRFDVWAKPPDNTQPRDRRAMMRALLEDRFKLRVHRETRQMPVYALTVAREGRLGPNLVPSKFDCEAFLAQRRSGGRAEEPVDANGESWCLYLIVPVPGVQGLRSAGSVTQLMQRLQAYVDRPIVDATGLSGNLEWVLRFASGPEAPADVPQLVTALQDQLGLKLEPRQAPVDVLVVDSVELPTPD
jgi:uncharacterized protein (TIGR03435 family)